MLQLWHMRFWRYKVHYSSVLNHSFFKISILISILSFSSFSAWAEESNRLSIKNNDFQASHSSDNVLQQDVDENVIDWSKPIVSRGFGLEESQGHTDEDALTQYQSGQVFYFFGEYDKAVKKWLPLLETNFPEAQASMGWLYQAGIGVEKDESKAFELYLKAAQQNNAIAQNNLGVMYENGIAVTPSVSLASQWYKRSAEQGYRYGQYNYANMLLLNKAVETDLRQARVFLQRAAEQGVRQANEKLSLLE